MKTYGIDMQVVAKRIRHKKLCSIPRLIRQIFTSSSDITELRYRRNKIGSAILAVLVVIVLQKKREKLNQ